MSGTCPVSKNYPPIVSMHEQHEGCIVVITKCVFQNLTNQEGSESLYKIPGKEYVGT